PGQLSFNNGTLETTASFTLNANRGIALTGPGTIDVNTGTTLIYNGVAAGTGALTKIDAGTLVLGGTDTYTGATNINGGVLSISADANLGTAPVAPTANQLTFNGGTLGVTADLTLDSNRGVTLNAGGGTFDVNATKTLTYNGIAAGSGALTKADTGT